MLHIIGVAHRAQSQRHGADQTDAQQAFTRCLSDLIEEVHPAFVAEEDSEEALAERNETSISRRIAEAQGIEHRFCDPNRQQRRQIGYRDGQELEIETFMRDDEGLSNHDIHLKARAIELGRYFPIRERFWLERLQGCRESDAIFVCGNAHIETFTALIEAEGVPYRIVERGIGVTTEENEDWREIQGYLDAHTHLRNG